MNITKGAIDKVASRKLAATAAAATWTIELTRPVAALAVAYIAGQGVFRFRSGQLVRLLPGHSHLHSRAHRSRGQSNRYHQAYVLTFKPLVLLVRLIKLLCGRQSFHPFESGFCDEASD